jgi:PBP1b-binding outer membrane lipoprotein LpoB
VRTVRALRPLGSCRRRDHRPDGGPSAYVLVLVIALVALLLGACSGDSGPARAAIPTTTAPATTGTAPATATTAATESRNAAVLAAYRAFWDDMIAVGKTANWRSPRMDDHATGLALAQAQATYRMLHQRGLVARGTIKVRAKVLAIKGNTATVYDCNSTSNFLAYDAKTGQLRDKSSGRSDGMTVTLVLRDGTWKVAKSHTEVGKCTR